MARVAVNGHQSGMRMRLHHSVSDDEDCVHSGSATGFSDGERDDFAHISRPATHMPSTAYDPVTQILDKIDAELVSLTRSQGSSSTATTATDSTVVQRPSSHNGSSNVRQDNGVDELSISQLGSGSSSYKPSLSFQSSGSHNLGSSDRDTGIGTSTNSLHENSNMSNAAHRAIPDDVQPLEPGDSFKGSTVRFSPQSNSRQSNIPEVYINGQHLCDDDKSKREQQNGLPYEAKQVDDKFKEILQKRKGGYGVRMSADDDTQTIRTEDFADKFHDTMVYSSGTGPGYPPIYPKPTPTSSLPRPSARSSLKFHPGHGSDADSVRTEDFETSFKDLMVAPGNQTESDLDPANNAGADPIHTKVKQLLKATAKYRPKSEQKTKQHVRICPSPTQYNHIKGDDSDDTLCSDKEDRVSSPRSHDTSSIKTDDRDKETRKEIARETDRIRREMERERRAKTSSPPAAARDRSPTRTYLSLTTPKSIYDKGDRPNIPSSTGGSSGAGGKSLSDEEKQERTAELKATQNALDVTQNALSEARKDLKDVQAQFEDARTQLMLSEYKRENTTKELVRLSDDVRRKKDVAKNLESQASQRREELKQFDAIGFTKDEAVQIIEENEKMKGRLRNLDAIHAERDELIQQLESTKQELFHEQKRARGQIDELKEELENITSTYEQLQTEKDDSTKKLQKLENSFKKIEKEKNELIQEKTRQYEEERDRYRKEKNEWRKRNLDEAENIRQDLIRMTNKVAGLQDEVRAKDDINLQLRDEIIELQHKEQQENVSKTSILDEHKKTLQTLRKETDVAMVQLRESLFLEKQKTIDALRNELEQERRDISSRSEERYANQVNELEAILKAKTDEISHLSKLVNKLETELTRTKVRKDDEAKQQVQEAVATARKVLEDDKDWAVQQERDSLQHEHRQQLKKLQDELARMQAEQRGLEARLKEQRNEELDEMKNSNKAAIHDKLIAVARAKDLMKQEYTAELDRIKEQMKNEHKMEIDKLKETIRMQEDELYQFREERMKHVRQQKECHLNLDRTERTLIHEINEECRKTSEVLGLNPRKVNFSSSLGNTAAIKSPTTTALANLRACNEELRMHVGDLQGEIDQQHNAVNLNEKQKDEALGNLRRQLEREKEEEMARLKERLVRGLAHNDYRNNTVYQAEIPTRQLPQPQYEYKTYPNERSLRQMSEQQQHDLERLEREINKLAMTSGRGSPEDIDYAKQLVQLQSKVKQLQTENNSLRRAKLNNVSSSSPDLTKPDMFTPPNYRKFAMHSQSPSPSRDQQRLASNLELRMKEHDYETETLTEHQRRNRDVMSRKMSDMSKLQNTLTNQAKELIQLEKAYTQLNKYGQVQRPHSAMR